MRRYVHVVVVVARSCKRRYCYPVVVVASHVSVAMLRRNYKLSTQHPPSLSTPLSLSLTHSRNHAHNHQRSNINGINNMHYNLYISKSSIAQSAQKRGSATCQDMCMGRMIDMPRRMRNLRAAHLISCTASVAGSVRL